MNKQWFREPKICFHELSYELSRIVDPMLCTNVFFMKSSLTWRYLKDKKYVNRGFYIVAQRSECYFRVVKTIFYERVQRVCKILFSTRENNVHISSSYRET